jgi:hypothetical protein
VYEGLHFIATLNWLTIDNGDEALSAGLGRQRHNNWWISAYEKGAPAVLVLLPFPNPKGSVVCAYHIFDFAAHSFLLL